MFYLAPLMVLRQFRRKGQGSAGLPKAFTYELIPSKSTGKDLKTRATHPMRNFRKTIKVIKTLNEISGIHFQTHIAYHEGQSPGFLRLPHIERFLTTVVNTWQLSDKVIDQIAAVAVANPKVASALTE